MQLLGQNSKKPGKKTRATLRARAGLELHFFLRIPCGVLYLFAPSLQVLSGTRNGVAPGQDKSRRQQQCKNCFHEIFPYKLVDGMATFRMRPVDRHSEKACTHRMIQLVDRLSDVADSLVGQFLLPDRPARLPTATRP